MIERLRRVRDPIDVGFAGDVPAGTRCGMSAVGQINRTHDSILSRNGISRRKARACALAVSSNVRILELPAKRCRPGIKTVATCK